MRSTFTFLRVRGIAIGAHWSWLIVAALVLWSLAGAFFPAAYPGRGDGTYLAMGIAATLLFFGSVLLHELGHALRAVREGMDIHEITLWLLGGVAHLRERPVSAGGEFRVAIAGPAVTAVLAVAFAGVTAVGNALGWPGAAVGVADYLARINLIVLAFNLAPAFPLDGGRLLRSWLWRRQRDYLRATLWAARTGRVFGVLLVALGIAEFLTGTGLTGLWLILVGFFLTGAAQAEASEAVARDVLHGVPVSRLMEPAETVEPGLPVREFLDRAAVGRFSSYPVTEEGRLHGAVSIRQAAGVPAEQHGMRTVAEVMTPHESVTVLHPDADAGEAMGELRGDTRRAVVTGDDGRVAGVVALSDFVRAMEVRRAQRRRPPGGDRNGRGRRGVLPALTVVGIAFLLAASLLYHPPYLVMSPGPSFDVADDVEVSGTDVTPVRGEYLATTVQLRRSNALSTLFAVLRPDRELVKVSDLLPEGRSWEEYGREQREQYERSARMAAAAAARAAGMPVRVEGSGVVVTGVMPDAPAAGRLRAGDVIVAVDGRSLHHAPQLRERIAPRATGTRFELTVEREGSRRTMTVRSTELPSPADGSGLGIGADTRDLRIELPFDVRVRQRPGVGGPSAGLAYALATADLIDRTDYAGGRTVAATGTIDTTGRVGPVGGTAQKAVGAQDRGAGLFVVPRPEAADARTAADLPVHGTEDLAEALRLLRTTA